MAFNIATTRYFKHTLNGLPGGPDGATQSMDVTYRVLDDGETKDVNLLDTESARDFLRSAVFDIADLTDIDDKPIPFSADLLDQLTTALDLRQAMVRGYGIGLAKAASGN